MYQDPRGASTSHLEAINKELKDVTGIMYKNVEDVLNRGENLNSASKRYSIVLRGCLADLHFFSRCAHQECRISLHLCDTKPRSTEKQHEI